MDGIHVTENKDFYSIHIEKKNLKQTNSIHLDISIRTDRKVEQTLDRTEEIYLFIKKELSNFNFNVYSKGYKYLTEAILLSIQHPNLLQNLQNSLYQEIAKNDTKITASQVKWNIEKSIKYMLLETDEKVLMKYFGKNDNRFTAKLFIYQIATNYNLHNMC